MDKDTSDVEDDDPEDEWFCGETSQEEEVIVPGWTELEGEYQCCICQKWVTGHGNNARPLKDGICCDDCNILVIEQRLYDAWRNEDVTRWKKANEDWKDAIDYK
tara:strand:+ start:2488 stop:2799 length:312 start_codon:yes stop_codon:yes gene_type:complete